MVDFLFGILSIISASLFYSSETDPSESDSETLEISFELIIGLLVSLLDSINLLLPLLDIIMPALVV